MHNNVRTLYKEGEKLTYSFVHADEFKYKCVTMTKILTILEKKIVIFF